MLRISSASAAIARAATIRRTSASSRLAASRWSWNLGAAQTRGIHERRALLYPVEEGLGEFLPPQALKAVGIEYQQGLLDRLNDEVRGTEEESQSIVDTVINTAHIREKTLAFNYASLALNNSFFLDHLKPPPSPPHTTYQHQISQSLGAAIRQQHGSVAQLKSAFSAAATGMFTSGYVWFVADKNGNTGVLPTFGPGTLLIRSRSYMASSKGLILGEGLGIIGLEDQQTPTQAQPQGEGATQQPSATPKTSPGVAPSSPTSGTPGTPPPQAPPHSRSLHTSPPRSSDLLNRPASVWGDSPFPSSPFGGTTDPLLPNYNRAHPQSKVDMLNIGEVLYPLFCLSVHEHNWLSAGYGVWGKEEWVKQFWAVLDWEKVSRSYDKVRAGSVGQ
ncbi:hypothetical protein AX16_005261 [Volvariella volvacea WC 439]|nr:hypothetical protein AX16_005261 [Volvariella volvacea WC 439]